MGLKDKLYSDGSPSKLDQPIGIQQGRDRQATDRAFQNEEHVQKKQYMLGRRMYRTAMRSNNPGAQIAAMEALGNAGLGFNAGIKQAGQTGAANRGRFESTQGQLDVFNGNGTPLQGQQRLAGESQLDFAGRQQQSGDQPSSGAGLSGGGAVPGLPGIGGVLDAVDSMNGQAPTDQPSFGGPLRQGLTNPSNPKREMALANLKAGWMNQERAASGGFFNSQPSAPLTGAQTPEEAAISAKGTIAPQAPSRLMQLATSLRGLDTNAIANHQPGVTAPATIPQGSAAIASPTADARAAVDARAQAEIGKIDYAARVQQRLRSDKFGGQINELENDMNVSDKGHLMASLSRAFNPPSRPSAPDPGPMDFDNFDPKNYPDPHSSEEQKAIDDGQYAQLAALKKRRSGPLTISDAIGADAQSVIDTTSNAANFSANLAKLGGKSVLMQFVLRNKMIADDAKLGFGPAYNKTAKAVNDSANAGAGLASESLKTAKQGVKRATTTVLSRTPGQTSKALLDRL